MKKIRGYSDKELFGEFPKTEEENILKK